jgi:hypothetical protein
MEESISKDNAIKILAQAIEKGRIKVDHYLKEKNFRVASEVFVKEVAIAFRDFGFPKLSERIELHETVGFKTQDVLEECNKVEDFYKRIEEVFKKAFFDY